jgi:cytochrome P450
MRVHPAFSFPLERLVPPGPPVKIGGYDLPAGTVVGMNAWVVHRNPRVFGEDAMSFRPERWIDSSPEQLNQMERSFLSVSSLKSHTLIMY